MLSKIRVFRISMHSHRKGKYSKTLKNGTDVSLFFTLLGFLCSYRGIYSIFPSNQFPFNNPL
jgi:hypothetical protein